MQDLAQKLQIPYLGTGHAAFAAQAVKALLRRKKETTIIAEGCCFLCGDPAQEVDHEPQQARSTEKTDERKICRLCHEQKPRRMQDGTTDGAHTNPF